MRPVAASICVAQGLQHWLKQLLGHLEGGTLVSKLVESLPILLKAAAFLADSAEESLRILARTSALQNSWPGDTTSKQRLCGLPFQRDLLFGPELDKVLERSADTKKGFPDRPRPSTPRRSFRDTRGQTVIRSSFSRGRWAARRGRGPKDNILFKTQ